MKKCIKCKESKQYSDYHKASANKDGHKNICKSCVSINDKLYKQANYKRVKENKRKWQKDNKEHLRNYHFKKNYNITLNDYNIMLVNQDNKCRICNENKDTLVVDHCHSTNEVRGLLCNDCNLALGMFKDDINRLNNAIKYLKELPTSITLAGMTDDD